MCTNGLLSRADGVFAPYRNLSEIRVDLVDGLENFGINTLIVSGRQLNFPDARWKDG